jgi:hypothetical protein
MGKWNKHGAEHLLRHHGCSGINYDYQGNGYSPRMSSQRRGARVSATGRLGKEPDMTDETQPPDVVDDKASDVLAEDEVVHVPPATEELAESLEQGSSYLPDVPHWDEPDDSLPAAR